MSYVGHIAKSWFNEKQEKKTVEIGIIKTIEIGLLKKVVKTELLDPLIIFKKSGKIEPVGSLVIIHIHHIY